MLSRMLARLARTTPWSADVGLLVLRVGFGLGLAWGHGLAKILALGTFAESVASRGIPLPWVLGPAAALAEFAGGILVALGLVTRAAAAAMLATMLVAAFHIHAADPFKKKELALAYATAALVVSIAGPGRLSLDARLFGRGR